jgi:peptidylprolyl isomerase
MCMSEELMKKVFPVIAIMFLCGALVVAIAMWVGPETQEAGVDDVAQTEEKLEELPAPLTAEELAAYEVDMIDKNNPVAVFTTNKGVVELELFDNVMPITVGNFVKLANEGFYNGTKFHRIIDGFMVQGGDPNSKTDEVLKYGQGGPGYTITDEFVERDYLTNVRGTIAMANTGQPNSGGSQFFINLVDNKNLDFNVPDLNNSAHPVFGQVIKGMEVVDAMAKVRVNPASVPLEPVVVESVVIRTAE